MAERSTDEAGQVSDHKEDSGGGGVGSTQAITLRQMESYLLVTSSIVY